MGHSDLDPALHERRPWNAGQNVGAKRPLKPRDIWAIRFFLDEHHRLRDRALFDLAIDSKLRGCDLVKLKIGDVLSAGQLRNRATVVQQKTGKPVQFEIMTEARRSLGIWLDRRGHNILDFVFPSRNASKVWMRRFCDSLGGSSAVISRRPFRPTEKHNGTLRLGPCCA